MNTISESIREITLSLNPTTQVLKFVDYETTVPPRYLSPIRADPYNAILVNSHLALKIGLIRHQRPLYRAGPGLHEKSLISSTEVWIEVGNRSLRDVREVGGPAWDIKDLSREVGEVDETFGHQVRACHYIRRHHRRQCHAHQVHQGDEAKAHQKRGIALPELAFALIEQERKEQGGGNPAHHYGRGNPPQRLLGVGIEV